MRESSDQSNIPESEFGTRRDDIAVFVHGNDPATLAPGEARGEVYVPLSTGTSFEPRKRWHDFFAPGPEKAAASNFNGDGMDDIVAFLQHCCSEPDRGDVYVALSSDQAFLPSAKWNDFFSLDGTIPMAGDFDGDQRSDVISFARNSVTPGGNDFGHVFVARSTGSGQTFPLRESGTITFASEQRCAGSAISMATAAWTLSLSAREMRPMLL